MRPKKKRIIMGVIVGSVLIGSVGFLFMDANKQVVDSTAESVLEELNKQSIYYHLRNTAEGIELMDLTHEKQVTVFQTQDTVQEKIGMPFIATQTEFKQAFLVSDKVIEIVAVNVPTIDTVEIQVSEKIQDVHIEKDTIYVLTEQGVEVFDLKGSLMRIDKLQGAYKKILVHKGEYYLFKGKEMFNHMGKKIYLAGEVHSLWEDENNLYAINDFGSGKGNHMLIKINPEDMKVEAITAIKPDSYIVGEVNNELYLKGTEEILVHKTSNLEGRILNLPSIKNLLQ